MGKSPRQVFEFGQFRLDVDRTRLTRDGELVSLPPKAVSLLAILLKHQGRAVEKEELIEAIWPDMVVEDSNLTQTVHILRKTLGKFPDCKITIETLPRLGYRLIAELDEVRSESAETVTAPGSPVTIKPQEIESSLNTGQTKNGLFQSVQKQALLWLQKKLVKLGAEQV